VLPLKREVLGPRHPDTLLSMVNAVINLAAQGRIEDAVALQRQMQPEVLA